MSLIDRSKSAGDLWAAVLSHVPAPDSKQLVLWANRFTDAHIEKAFMRTHRRFAPGHMTSATDPTIIHKYVTGLLVNIEREQGGGHHAPRLAAAPQQTA
jgi:hypothetical protein